MFFMFFMFFIIRAGIQILADHPRLYWKRDCTPGTEWFRFQKDVPEHRIWTSKDDAVTLPQWLGIPGLRHTIGLARWWHLSADLLWTVNGIAFYVLLFATNQWLRIVPLSWDVFPNSVSMAIQYASLNFPVENLWTRFNALQQLTYFITLFVAAPISIVTGLLQGPAISNRLGWVGRIVNRQAARSIHFISFTWFVLFILAHGGMVFMTGLQEETNYMFAGVHNGSWSGFFIFLVAMAVVVCRLDLGLAVHHPPGAAGAEDGASHGRMV
jgi:thiosulfate reductase cytochrome b subunit